MAILDVALDPATVIVAGDPGKVTNRVWVSDGTDLLESRCHCPSLGRGSLRWRRCSWCMPWRRR